MGLFSVNEVTTFRWPLEQDLREYREAGVEAIGIWRQKISDFDEAAGIELIADSQFAVSSLSWAGGFTGSDGRTHAESIQDGREAIRLACALRAGCLLIHTGARAGHTHNHARRLFRAALDKLLPLAEELSVTLAIEPMCSTCGTEWTFLGGAAEALQLVEAVDSNWFRMTLDTYHLAQQADVWDLLPRVAKHAALVQLGDSKRPAGQEQNRCLLGDGQLPVRQMVQALHRSGYRGCYELELLGEDVEATCYRQLLQRSKKTFDSWMTEVAAA